jgi:hypothetical protein
MFSKPRWRSDSNNHVLFTDIEKAHSTLSHQSVVNVVAAATPELLPLARLSRSRGGVAAVDATEGTPYCFCRYVRDRSAFSARRS